MSVYTLSSEQRAMLYDPEASTKDPPLYDALPPAYHESADWAEAVASRISDVKMRDGPDIAEPTMKSDSQTHEANIHELE